LNELENLARAGQLTAEPPNQKDFDALLDSGRKRLADAGKPGLSREGRFDLAYNAAHALSLAAMRWHGYRAEKRFVVFQALPHTLGLGPEIWRVLDKAHAMRNKVEYEGYTEIDEQLLRELLRAVALVRGAVEKLGPVATQKRK
jgi:hypothetical protein